VLKCPDDRKTELSAPKRRTRAEVQQLVAEFVSSGMRRSEFCQSRGLSFSTLDRHLKKLRWKRRRKPISSAGRLVPVELAALEYPELELSTNLAENSMRPVALGRKNWLHIGSPQAGPKVAAILSVVESCRRLQVPVRDYFSTILPALADLPIRCLPDLTPAVWVARHS
jgi:DNA-binding transcriptional ArsR family regulator